MIAFSLRGDKCRKVGSSYSRAPLEIKGLFHLTGPQPVGVDGGAPTWVADLFDSNPEIKHIAISTDKDGIVWNRIPRDQETE